MSTPKRLQHVTLGTVVKYYIQEMLYKKMVINTIVFTNITF